MSRSLPGLNVQWPISEQIYLGNKSIETRTYPAPQKYIDVPLCLIETPGRSGKFLARVTAIIKIKRCFLYESEDDFYLDFEKHLVDRGSLWAWKSGKGKWGWEIKVIKRYKVPKRVLGPRGIVFSKAVRI